MPPLPRPIRKVGAPLAVIITLGTLAGLLLILLTAVNPVGTDDRFRTVALAMTPGAARLPLLDRWEPSAATAGARPSCGVRRSRSIVSVALEAYIESTINPGRSEASFVTVAVVAPVVEGPQGLFLLIMIDGPAPQRTELLTRLPGLRGPSSVGFAWLEDLF